MAATTTSESLAELLERGLMQQYGPLIANDDLRQALGYPSKEAFRQALVRRSVPVPVFDVVNRRGKFALSVDVARWLAAQRERAVNNVGGPQQDQGGPMS